MKLSLISLETKNVENVKNYLDSLLEQNSADFEVILCLNGKESENKQVLNILPKYYELFGNRLVVVYNSKINSYQHNLLSAFRIMRGDYAVTFNSDISSIKYNYVEKMIEASSSNDVEILEFKPRLTGSISWKPLARIVEREKIDLTKNPLPFAYVYPFIFNKIIKKSVAQRVLKYKTKNLNDTKMSVEINYILMLEAKSYTYLDYRIFRENFPSDMWLSSKKSLNMFEDIEKYLVISNRKLFEEIRYAKYYFIKLLMTAFLKETNFTYKNIFKTKDDISEKRGLITFQKHVEILGKLESIYKTENYFLTNPYFLRNNEEVTLMSMPISKLKNTKILKRLD
nr:glycosyltransferase family 2 protein [Mycoplasmopsis canis]WQQ12364.1 glycosyltransferase family 2 protein [Mycoplasmopsis canis]